MSPSSADELHGDQHSALKGMFWLALPASQRPLLDKPPPCPKLWRTAPTNELSSMVACRHLDGIHPFPACWVTLGWAFTLVSFSCWPARQRSHP